MSTKKTVTQADQKHEGVARVLDAAGRTIKEVDQLGNMTTYDYTIDGLVATVWEESVGVVTHNTYDPVTRAIIFSETTGANTSDTSRTAFEYDPVTGEKIASFDPTDRSHTEIRYTYDVFGNMTHTYYPDGKTISHVFTENGQKTSTTDIVGNVTRYEYDRFGVLTAVTQTTRENSLLGHVSYEYDDYGRVIQLTRGNNVITRYTFTSTNQIATEKTTHDGAVVYWGVYEYDSHENLIKRVDTRPDGTDSSHPVTETTTYAYNSYNKLISSHIYSGENPTGKPSTSRDYEISVSGNITTETLTENSATTVREFEYNALNQITAVITNGNRAEQMYDKAGNLIRAADGTRYTYNVHNEVLTETDPRGTITTNTYWVSGQRNHIITTQNNENLHTEGMYWDGATLINDTHFTAGSSEPTNGSYLIGLSRHTRNLTDTEQKTTNYYVTDRHANTIATTNTSGEITAAYTYTDYGVPTEHTAQSYTNLTEHNPFQYAAQYTTPSGMQYLGARIYDPVVMSFTTRDTADQFNLYAYANANPITFVDPSGQASTYDKVILGVTFAAIVYAFLLFGVMGGVFDLGGMGVIDILRRGEFWQTSALVGSSMNFLSIIPSWVAFLIPFVDLRKSYKIVDPQLPEHFLEAGLVLAIGGGLALACAEKFSLNAAKALKEEYDSFSPYFAQYAKSGRFQKKDFTGVLLPEKSQRKPYYIDNVADEQIRSFSVPHEGDPVIRAERTKLSPDQIPQTSAVVYVSPSRAAKIKMNNNGDWELNDGEHSKIWTNQDTAITELMEKFKVQAVRVSGGPGNKYIFFKKELVRDRNATMSRYTPPDADAAQ